MSAPAMSPLELILRQCAASAPQPWYPSDFARHTGTPRDSLDPHLERLRMGGFVQLTEWTEGHGQGYILTPAGRELLERPKLMERAREGYLPDRAPGEEPSGPPVMHMPEIEGDALRAALFSDANPIVTRLLILANIGFFLFGMIVALREGVGIGAYIGRPSNLILLKQGAIFGPIVYARNEWWRLLTCCFVHIGIIHIAINMYSLWIIGPLLERILGPWRYLLLYLLAGIGGSLGVLISSPMTVTAGASGAIWGLMTGLAVYVFANRRSLPPPIFQAWFRQLITVILLNAFLTMGVSGISKGGHFGGGLAGALLVVPVDYLRRKHGSRVWLAAVVIVGISLVGFGYTHRTVETTFAGREIPANIDADPRVEEAEESRFIDQYAKLVRERDTAASQLYNEVDRAVIFWNPDERNQDEVKEKLGQIKKEITALEQTKQQLTEAGPFMSPVVERARQAGINLMAGYVSLLNETAECLRQNKKCDLKADEQKLIKLRSQWNALFR
jgi:membrane associated rhomboid family serine protease